MSSKPNIISFDIETSPNTAYVWGKYEQDVIAYLDQFKILSFSAKYLDGKQITKGLIDYPLYKRDKNDDSALVKDLWHLFDEADVLIAHNGNKFDIKKSNARFIAHNLPKPSPFKTVDTLLVARNNFAFNSNRLDDLGDYLDLGRKVHTGGFELWKGCIDGDKKSWDLMKKYNAQDVVLLEKVYKKFLPWIQNHPNYGSFLEGRVCPNCGGNHLQSRGIAKTLSATYQRYQCQDCRTWSRAAQKEKSFQTLKSI